MVGTGRSRYFVAATILSDGLQVTRFLCLFCGG
jgi:hypothetical protein